MFVTTIPGAMESAAAGLAGIGSTVTASNAAAAAPTIGVLPPAAEEEASALLALAFSTHGQLHQVTQAVGSVVHAMFVATMGLSAGSYAASEALNAVAMA